MKSGLAGGQLSSLEQNGTKKIPKNTSKMLEEVRALWFCAGTPIQQYKTADCFVGSHVITFIGTVDLVIDLNEIRTLPICFIRHALRLVLAPGGAGRFEYLVKMVKSQPKWTGSLAGSHEQNARSNLQILEPPSFLSEGHNIIKISTDFHQSSY